MAEDDTRNEEEEEALDAAAPAEGGEPTAAKKKKKKKKKKKPAATEEGADDAEANDDAADAAEDDADDAGDAADGAEGEAKKKKKKRSKKKKKPTGTGSKEPLSRLLGGFTDSYVRYGQTEPPTIPVSKLFKADAFPVGEIQDYEGGNAKRVTDAEKRSADRMRETAHKSNSRGVSPQPSTPSTRHLLDGASDSLVHAQARRPLEQGKARLGGP